MAGSATLAESLGVAGVLAEARSSTVVVVVEADTLEVVAEVLETVVLTAVAGALKSLASTVEVTVAVVEALTEAPLVLVVEGAGAPTVTRMVEVTASVVIAAST